MTSSHPTTRPVPVVLLARRRPRPPLRPPARPPVPRGRPRPGPADRHHLDQGGQAQRPVSALLHRRRRRRQAGRSHRPTPPDRGGPAAAQGGHAADPRPGRHPDEAVRAARPGGRHPSQPDPRPGRLALRLRPRLRRPRPCSSPTRRGESSPCRCWPGSTSARRTCRASTRSIGRRSGPSWSWPSSCCGGPSPGWACWGCRSGWWPTGPMPRRPSSSRRWPWG